MILSIFALALVLSACNSEEDKQYTPNNGDEPKYTVEDGLFDPLADGVLTVGMDLRWAPFETKDSNGDPSGISVDVAHALGEYFGVEVEIIDLEFGSLIVSLNTQEIDVIIASMSITEDRAEAINFSDPYFYFPLITVLNKDFQDTNNVTSKEELFAISGVNYVGPRSFVSLSIPETEALNPVILEVNDANAALLEVVTGSSDAFIISASSAAAYHDSNPTTTELLWDPITYSPIGMGTRKTDTAGFLTAINDFIDSLDEPGGLYEQLSADYDSVIAADLPGQTMEFYYGEDEE
jgi:polar amino acid transport system substrate-binding protein